MFGAGLYICAYFLLLFGLIKGQGFIYPLMNLLAAVSVLISLTTHFNLASLIIQASFVTNSLFGMTRVYFLTRAVRFTAAERFYPSSPTGFPTTVKCSPSGSSNSPATRFTSASVTALTLSLRVAI